MEITDLKVIEKNKIIVEDSLKMALLRFKVSVNEDTTLPESNDLIVYVNNSTYTFTLSNKLNANESFEIKPMFNGKKVELKAVVNRNDNTTENVTYKDIILNEGVNEISTNYTDALLELVYPKDTDLVNYFLTTTTNLTTNSGGTSTGSGLSFDDIYPVGSIYMSLTDSNPSTLFGGTWERICKGKTLMGVDETDTDFNTVNKTGGEKTHTLTINEMPSHKHDVSIPSSGAHNHTTNGRVYEGNNGPAVFESFAGWGSVRDVTINSTSSAHTHTVNETNKGGNAAHNNLMPYLTCYIWTRTE